MTEPKDAGHEREPWYRKLMVGIEIGPTGANDRDRVYFSKARGKDWVDALLRAKAEYGVVFMKDMEFAYYNSRVARKCPNLGDRDLLREILDAAKPHGLPIVAYCQVQYDDSSWRAHPEWRMKGADGSDLGGRLCYNSGYIEFIKAVLAEMMEYEIVGFHVDMLDYGFGPPVGCWCESCRSGFEKAYGRAMPPGETWDESWDLFLQFRTESNARFCREVERFVKERRPELSVDFNYHGYPPFNWYPGQLPAKHALHGDFVTAEGLPWTFGHNNPSMLSLFLRAARPQGPAQVATSRGIWDYHDFTVKPAAELRWEVLTYASHGVQCTMVDKLYYDGSLEPLAYDRVGEAFGEVLAKREYFGHEPYAEVGLYYSARTRDWWGRTDPPRYMRAFWGAHLAMMRNHIPMGMIVDENASLEALERFPVVVLPNVTILSEQEVAMLDGYVRKGGRLIVTGLTGVCDRYGNVTERSVLQDLCGLRLVRCELQHHDNYIRLPEAIPGAFRRVLPEAPRIVEGIPPSWTMLVHGPMAVYEPGGAVGLGELMPAIRSQQNLWVGHMSAGAPVSPALFVNRVGEGTVVTVPCALDAAFVGEYRMPEHGRLLRNIVRTLNPAPLLRIEASAHVEAIVRRDTSRPRYYVHFVAWGAPPTFSSAAFPQGKRVLPPVMEEEPYFEATVTVNIPFKSMALARRGVRMTRTANKAMISGKAVHEVLIINLA